MVRKRTKTFLKESVVLFGFLNGLFLAIGINPGATILAIVGEILDNVTGGNGWIALALTLLPIVLLVVALYLIHKRAGWLGFLAVGAAFLSGLWLLTEPVTGVVLLLAALATGYVATSR